jgi:hypothetical protein
LKQWKSSYLTRMQLSDLKAGQQAAYDELFNLTSQVVLRKN